MNKNKTQKGITLIALIITIIIMLILVAVTVTIAINGGLFGIAKDAKSKTENELAKENALSTGRVEIDNVWYDSMEDYINGNKSANQGDGREVVERPETVAGLKAGQYVNYVDADGNEILSIVLYDEAYNTENGTNYGIQIITADIVEQVELGADWSYSDHDAELWWDYVDGSVKDLLQSAKKYLNTAIASDTRCVGSSPDGLVSTSPDNVGIYDEESNYYSLPQSLPASSVIDCIQLNKIGKIVVKSGAYWVSHFWYCSNDGTDGDYLSGVCFFSDDGNIYLETVGQKNAPSGTGECWKVTSGLRPCFKLIPEVKIVGGSGTEKDPYKLEV